MCVSTDEMNNNIKNATNSFSDYPYHTKNKTLQKKVGSYFDAVQRTW